MMVCFLGKLFFFLMIIRGPDAQNGTALSFLLLDVIE